MPPSPKCFCRSGVGLSVENKDIAAVLKTKFENYGCMFGACSPLISLIQTMKNLILTIVTNRYY